MDTEILSINEIKDSLKAQLLKHGTLFHNFIWLSTIEEGLDKKCKFLKTTENNQTVALTPFFEWKMGPFKFLGSPLRGTFTPYLGPVWLQDVSDNEKLKILKQQHQTLLKLKPNYVEWGINSNLFSEIGFGQGKNWISKTSETFLLEIKPNAEIMWSNLEKRGRNMARKAEKNNVKIKRLAGTQKEIDLFYQMLIQTFERRGAKVFHPKKFFEALIKHLMPKGQLLFLKAEINGRIASMGFFPYSTNEIHFLSGASNPEYYKYAPNNLMHWKVIEFAVENGIQKYDLGGKGIPSIDKFKESFGPNIASHDKRIWMTPLTKILLGIYERLKKKMKYETDNFLNP